MKITQILYGSIWQSQIVYFNKLQRIEDNTPAATIMFRVRSMMMVSGVDDIQFP